MSKNQLIFFGNERLASGVETTAPILSSLIDAGYDIPFVVINQHEMHGRNKSQPAVVQIAEQHSIPILRPDRLSEITDDIQDSGATCAVLAAFGQLIPQAVLDVFEHGILNLHPSLLPKYRGSTPIESAILHGDSLTGISLMRLVKEMDAGPIYGTRELELTGSESKQNLYESLVKLGNNLLLDMLPGILTGDTKPLPQNEDQATYYSTLEKSDGEIDWSKPAVQIEREIRAYLGWPGSFTTLNGRDIVVTKATLSNLSGPAGTTFKHDKSFGVYCAEQSVIIERLKPAGKKEMDSVSFLNGQQNFL